MLAKPSLVPTFLLRSCIFFSEVRFYMLFALTDNLTEQLVGRNACPTNKEIGYDGRA